MPIVLALLAHVALALASLSGRDPIPEAILAVGVATVLASFAALTPRPRAKTAKGFGLPTRLLVGVVVLADLALFTLLGVDRAISLGVSPRPMVPVFAVLVATILSYGTNLLPRWRFPIALLAALAFGAWVLLAWPAPSIDVRLIQENACRDLLRGKDPYASVHPNIPFKPGFDADVSRAGAFMRSFPYPPLSILATLPGYLAGDIRWSLLLGSLGAASCFVSIARRRGLPPGHVSELAAVAVVCHPWGLPIVEAGFTEPLLLLAIVAYLRSLDSGGELRRGVLLSAALSVKQSGFLAVFPLLFARRPSPRTLATTAAFLALINVPFYLWDPAALRLGVLDSLARAPIRKDSLSLPALLASAYRIVLPPVLGVLAGALTLACVLLRVRGRGSLAQAAIGSAATCLAFFLFGRAGHLNYYWFCSALLWLSILLAFAEAGPGVVARSSVAPGLTMPSSEPRSA